MRMLVTRVALVVSVATIVSAVVVSAHHGDTNYDLTTEFTIGGVVTEFRFVNPHVQIVFETTDDKGTATRWMAQGTSPNMLVHRGWTSTTLKAGDPIQLTGNRARNGSPTMKVGKVLLDGKDLHH